MYNILFYCPAGGNRFDGPEMFNRGLGYKDRYFPLVGQAFKTIFDLAYDIKNKF